jgi:hypothetical protein
VNRAGHLVRAAARAANLAREAGILSGAIEGAFGFAGRFVVLLPVSLNFAHFFAEAGHEFGSGGVDFRESADFFAAHGFDRGFEDGFGDVVGIIEWIGKFGFLVHVVFRVLREGCVGGGGLDESDGDGSFVDFFDLDTEGVGETFDRVFGGGIHAR